MVVQVREQDALIIGQTVLRKIGTSQLGVK